MDSILHWWNMNYLSYKNALMGKKRFTKLQTKKKKKKTGNSLVCCNCIRSSSYILLRWTCMENFAHKMFKLSIQIEDQMNFKLKNYLNIFVKMSTILLYVHKKNVLTMLYSIFLITTNAICQGSCNKFYMF